MPPSSSVRRYAPFFDPPASRSTLDRDRSLPKTARTTGRRLSASANFRSSATTVPSRRSKIPVHPAGCLQGRSGREHSLSGSQATTSSESVAAEAVPRRAQDRDLVESGPMLHILAGNQGPQTSPVTAIVLAALLVCSWPCFRPCAMAGSAWRKGRAGQRREADEAPVIVSWPVKMPDAKVLSCSMVRPGGRPGQPARPIHRGCPHVVGRPSAEPQRVPLPGQGDSTRGGKRSLRRGTAN